MQVFIVAKKGRVKCLNLNDSSVRFYVHCVTWLGEDKGKKQFLKVYDKLRVCLQENEMRKLRGDIDCLARMKRSVDCDIPKIYSMICDVIKVSEISREIVEMLFSGVQRNLSNEIAMKRSGLKVLNKLQFCNRSKKLMKKFIQEHRKYVSQEKEFECVDCQCITMDISYVCSEYSKFFSLGVTF